MSSHRIPSRSGAPSRSEGDRISGAEGARVSGSEGAPPRRLPARSPPPASERLGKVRALLVGAHAQESRRAVRDAEDRLSLRLDADRDALVLRLDAAALSLAGLEERLAAQARDLNEERATRESALALAEGQASAMDDRLRSLEGTVEARLSALTGRLDQLAERLERSERNAADLATSLSQARDELGHAVDRVREELVGSLSRQAEESARAAARLGAGKLDRQQLASLFAELAAELRREASDGGEA